MTLVRCPQKALSFPNRIILGRSGLEHLVDLAAPLLLLLRAESPHKTLPQPPGSCPTACPLPQVSQPPDFDSEVLFTKHSPYPCPRVCLLFTSSIHTASPEPASSLYCSKVHCGPTDLACGSNQAVNPHRSRCASRLWSAPCLSRSSPVVSRFISLFSDVHFKNNKTPELDC